MSDVPSEESPADNPFQSLVDAGNRFELALRESEKRAPVSNTEVLIALRSIAFDVLQSPVPGSDARYVTVQNLIDRLEATRQ